MRRWKGSEDVAVGSKVLVLDAAEEGEGARKEGNEIWGYGFERRRVVVGFWEGGASHRGGKGDR